MKLKPIYLLAVSAFLISGSCRKEISNFEKGAGQPNVTDLESVKLIAQFSNPDGGSTIIHNPKIGGQIDVFVSILDANGRVLRTSSFGGSRNEYIHNAVRDDEGNIYVTGGTTSPELRMDPLKDTTDAGDGYVAKINKDGNMVWQRGYCDITSLHKGVWEDEFANISVINGKLYCVGFTQNALPISSIGEIVDYDTWLVIFDQNGSVIKDLLLPSIYKGANALNFGGGTWMDAIKLEDNNLVFRYVYMDYLSQGRIMDTTTLLFKWNTSTDQVMWSQYFLRTSPYGDILTFGQLGNGNLIGFDSYFNSYCILDQNTGNPISTKVIGNNTGSATSTIYLTKYKADNFKIGDDFYVVGWMNIGGGTTDLKPWMMKMDKQGNVLYNKTFAINSAGFYWIREDEQKNLQLTGSIAVFGTLGEKIFTMGLTPQGEVIQSNNQ